MVELTRDEFRSVVMNAIGRHTVSLCFTYSDPYDRVEPAEGVRSYSGFVADIAGSWYLVTAGHVIAEIESFVAGGVRLHGFCLDDGLHPDAKYRRSEHLIPFDFENASRYSVDEAEIGDFGAIFIDDVYRRLLLTNGIEAVSKDLVTNSESNPESIAYWIVGLPAEPMKTMRTDNAFVHKKSLAICTVDRMEILDLPESVQFDIGIKGYRSDDFYAKAPPASELTDGDSAELSSIVGLSGGPIFELTKGKDGTTDYRLIAIQSNWWTSERITRGCSATRCIEFLETEINKEAADNALKSTPG